MTALDSPKYVLIILVAVFFSFAAHEASHWLAGEMIGYDMTMTMNTAYPLGVDDFEQEWHGMVISAAGPLFTIFQAVAIYTLMRRRKRISLYPFLVVPFVMRLIAMAVGFRNPNDEARISDYLGLSIWTLPALVCLFLFYLVYKTSQRYELDLKFQAITFVCTLLFSSIVILVIK